MRYIEITLEAGGTAYQEVFNGNVVRYTDPLGATIEVSGGSSVVGEVFPVWALPDPVPEPQPEPEPVVRVLTKRQFRLLFTQEERELIDEFNVGFESHPALTVEQKRSIRSGLEDYRAAQEINLDDPATPAMLGLYEALGLIAPGRAAEILV